MNGRPRPLVYGLAIAVTTSAVGLSINFVTDHLHSVLAWTAVAVATFLTGIAAAVVEHTRITEPPPADEIVRDRLIIEMTIGPNGLTTFNASADGPDATRRLVEMVNSITPVPPPAPGLPSAPTLPKPLVVALVTSNRTRIARRLRKLERRYAGFGELDVRLCVDNQAATRQAALRDTEADVVVIDDHCATVGKAAPHVGGLNLAALCGPGGDQLDALAIILTCHNAAEQQHTEALRRSLHRPVAFLGFAGAVPARHRSHLYAALLDRLGALAGTHVETEQLRTALKNALLLAQKERPPLEKGRWTTEVLTPAPPPIGDQVSL